MSRPGGRGADPGEPREEGLSIFGPLELPRDETDYRQRPAYDPDDYGDAGGTRVATPSMLLPPPGAGAPVYPAGPPPGYPPPAGSPPVYGPPAGSPPVYGPPAGSAQPGPPPAGSPAGAPPDDDPFGSLFRPGTSTGPAPAPYASGPPLSVPPPPMGGPGGQPQYASPAMPPRQDDYPGAPSGGGRSVPRGALVAGGIGAAVVLLFAGLFAAGAFDGGDGKADAANSAGAGSGAPSASGSAGAAPPPSSAPAPKTQAQELDELMGLSAGARVKVNGAVTEIQKCGDVQNAVQTLNDAAAQRDKQIARLGKLKTDQIASGPQLVDWLRKAWTASAKSDRSLAAWGTENAQGECRDGKRAKDEGKNKRAADDAGKEATQAKNKAVALWNPVATQSGLPTRAATEI